MPITPTFIIPADDTVISGDPINVAKVIDITKASVDTKRRDIVGQANDGAAKPAILFALENGQGERYWVYQTEVLRDSEYAAIMARVGEATDSVDPDAGDGGDGGDGPE